MIFNVWVSLLKEQRFCFVFSQVLMPKAKEKLFCWINSLHCKLPEPALRIMIASVYKNIYKLTYRSVFKICT